MLIVRSPLLMMTLKGLSLFTIVLLSKRSSLHSPSWRLVHSASSLVSSCCLASSVEIAAMVCFLLFLEPSCSYLGSTTHALHIMHIKDTKDSHLQIYQPCDILQLLINN